MSEYLTIDGFESMTRQELYDMSARHILSTGVRSARPGDSGCVYSGTGCAAAPFLRPECREKADKADHGISTGWCTLAHVGFVPAHEENLISKLQQAHDACRDADTFMQDWAKQMWAVARSFGLSDAVVVEGMKARDNGHA